jgi:methyl-accepting chemotaxis protein
MSTEKNEKEIRQVNFRIDQASADAFRSFCTANGMNQAQGFDHLIQVLELNNAKAATPGRAVEIENFERLTKDLLAAYLTSLELGNTTEARVAERFKTDLQRKDRTIDELREKADQAVDEKEKLAGSFETLTEEKKQIEENALSMKQAMEAARKSANDLEELNHVLRDQVEQLQKKAAHYDEIVKISAAIKSENEQLKNSLVSSRMKLRQKRITKSRSGNLQPWSGIWNMRLLKIKCSLPG